MRPRRAAGATERDAEAEALAECLQHPRYEVLPLDGIEDAVLAHLDRDVKITVTASPRQGLDATLEVSERLARAGYAVVPHVSARLVRDAAHLRDLVLRVRAAGVRELFVPAGDPKQPAGAFAGAAALLAAMGELREEFDDVGITGYPESHHAISDEMTIRAMFEKAPMATYIVSQICFDAQVIATWIERVRERGTHLPIWIGVPGSVDHAKLVRISLKIGLGDSARFLRRHRGWTSRLITRRFRPDALIRELAPSVANPAAKVGGFHFYTFNELGSTERWRRRLLERLGSGA
jgi:methylenetetrahydrofolate reductase (NADPH)